MLARESGDTAMHMGALAGPVAAKVYLLLGAAAIMIITLWTSRRALSVSRTELLALEPERGARTIRLDASRAHWYV